jgi:hypothetical protein
MYRIRNLSDRIGSMKTFRIFLALTFQIALGLVASAAITDFDQWTLVEDPGHPGFSAVSNATSAMLSAGNTAIPAGTDIGYQSVNGSTVQTSSQGFFFSPHADFSLAINYEWTISNNASGLLGIGFGIGEDSDGKNSAGVSMVTVSGSPFLTFGGAARVGDLTQTPIQLSTNASLVGTLFVEYQASSGDVSFGASRTINSAAPEDSETFSGIQNQWTDENLMASFFVRSDAAPPLIQNWQGGQADVTFGNLRILSGSPVAVPEPSCIAVLGALGILAACRRRRTSAKTTFTIDRSISP